MSLVTYTVPRPSAIPETRAEVLKIAAEIARWRWSVELTEAEDRFLLNRVERLKQAADGLVTVHRKKMT